MWMLGFILLSFIAATQFFRMAPVDALLNISSVFDQNCNFLFWRFFLLLFVVAPKFTSIIDLCFNRSHFERLEIWHADAFSHFQNWLHFGHHPLIPVILAPFWLSETSQIPISWHLLRTHGRNSMEFGIFMYPHHLQNWQDDSHSLLIFLILAPFWLSETDQIWDFWKFSW